MERDFTALVYRYVTDPAFWVGGITVPVLIGITLMVSGAISDLLARIQQFFENSQLPGQIPQRPGPSPFQKLMTCALASLALLLIILTTVLLVTFIVPQLVR